MLITTRHQNQNVDWRVFLRRSFTNHDQVQQSLPARAVKAVGVKIYTQNTNTKYSFLVYHLKETIFSMKKRLLGHLQFIFLSVIIVQLRYSCYKLVSKHTRKNAKSKSEWVGTNIRGYSVFDKIISFSLVWDELSTIHFVEQVQNKSQFFNNSYILQLKAIFNTVPLNFIVTLILKSIFFTK